MPMFKDRVVDRIVILTGAGVSAESGLSTFRDSGGLWENHDPMEIATPEAFARDPSLVYRFYNERRQQLAEVKPNPAHRAIAELQRAFEGEVFLVTQNVDDLHERGGSVQVCHMHGELLGTLCSACHDRRQTRQSFDHRDQCPACGEIGSLRPDVVWFGEIPYHMDEIAAQLSSCSLFIAIGTSGAVYPAAGFVSEARHMGALAIEVNKERSDVAGYFHEHRTGPASREVPALVEELLS
ncbi:MAG: NAD-dependent deacylase [Pseudomonadota bacterium]